MSLKKQALQGFIWTYVEQSGGQIINFFVNILLTSCSDDPKKIKHGLSEGIIEYKTLSLDCQSPFSSMCI